MIVTVMPETALVSFEHWPFSFHKKQMSFPPSTPLKTLSFLDHCSCFNLPVPGVKNFVIVIPDLFSVPPWFSTFDSQEPIFSDEFPCRTILIRF